MEFAYEGFPFLLAGEGCEARHIAVEVEFGACFDDHEDAGAEVVDFHGLDADFFDTGRDFGPDVFGFMPVDVLAD